ncbi:Transposase IS4 [Popillia japonica]|uniref:Transposase IS4 n=1 Tax=Popillia japonica TaxID=7064 RepID=A0AAW1LAX8_POPJA
MSRRPLLQKELEELAKKIMDFDSDESSIEPFSGSDSDSYRPSDSSADDSDDDFEEPARGIKNKQKSHFIEASASLTQTNQNEPKTGSFGDSELSQTSTPQPTLSECGQRWGPIARNYKAIPSCTLASGIKPEVAALLANASPGEFYEAIVDDSIVSYIADQTNHYASCFLLETDASGNSRYHNWVPTTKSEIKHFLGLVAWMGLVKVPTLADYWSTDPLLNFSFSRSVFSCTGYTYNIIIYAGKENGERVTPEDIVTFLTQDIIGVGRTLVTDNWYTSLPLAKRMLDSDTHLIGTIRKNRKGLPKEVVDRKPKKGEVAAMENKDGITVLKWKDQSCRQETQKGRSCRHGEQRWNNSTEVERPKRCTYTVYKA